MPMPMPMPMPGPGPMAMSAEPREHPAAAAPPGFELERDALGRLVVRLADGTTHAGAQAVRAFPISAPDEGISLVDADGHELAWIREPARLPEATRALLADALAMREFMPEIRGIRAVSGFVTPCTWEVLTDRGETRFVLPSEDAIRRLSRSTLLIGDHHGIHYLVRDIGALDRTSRRLLDRFL